MKDKAGFWDVDGPAFEFTLKALLLVIGAAGIGAIVWATFFFPPGG